MLRILLLLPIFLVSGIPGSSVLPGFHHETTDPFLNMLTKFQKCNLPCETGKLKPVLLKGEDSIFVKSAGSQKKLVAVTDTTANVWDDADDEGKIHFDFPELIGAGAQINISNNIVLLEIVDMYRLKGESESNKQGDFSRTTYLCTFSKTGKLINAVVSNFNLANEHGSISRWSCQVNAAAEITIKEYGARTEMKDTYSFTTVLKIKPDGKIVKVRSTRP
ncbi:MAG: hypothetical protein ACXVPN_11950 [Bacteroidia bacterium]